MGTVLTMQKTPRIVVVGSINMDLVIRTAHLPVPGETILGESGYQTYPGGKGANQAVASAKLGAQTTMLGAVGQDAFGDELIANLQTHRIQTDALVRKTNTNSGVALIGIDESNGENFIIVAGGANRSLSPEDIQYAKSVIQSADILICQLEIPIESVHTALTIAKENHVTTVLNAAPVCELSDGLLSLVDFLIVNETEAVQLSHYSISELEDVEQASAILLGKGVKCVVLTMGAKGANVVDANHRIYVPTFPVKAIDTVGAGDAFVGAFSIAIAQGKPLADALKFSNAVGALATTKPGAQSGMPSHDEVQAFLRKFESKDFG